VARIRAESLELARKLAAERSEDDDADDSKSERKD